MPNFREEQVLQQSGSGPGGREDTDVVGDRDHEQPVSSPVDVSVVIPVCERYDDVRELYETYKADLDETGCVYEVIYVLDGDYPDVLAQLKTLLNEGEPLKIIRFAISFGEATALTAGFSNSDAPLIVTLPAYYQVGRGAVARVMRELPRNDMVIVRRWPRLDSGFNRLQTKVFYKVQKFITGQDLHDLGCGVRGFKRQVVDEISLYGDLHRFMPIIAQRLGFRVKELDIPQSPKEKRRRVYRPGVYPRRLLDLLTVFFLSKFTKKPLRFYGLIGSTIALFGALTIVWLVVERLFLGVGLAERPALLLASLMVVLGVQLFGLGLIGELIIFTHAREIKEYTIEEIIN